MPILQMWKLRHGVTEGPHVNTQLCFILQSAFLVTRTYLPALMDLREWLKDFTFEPLCKPLTKPLSAPGLPASLASQSSFSRMLGP